MQEAEGKSSRGTRYASLTILAIILLVGGYFRFTNLNWDEGLWIHPDEAHMQSTLGAIHTPDSLSLYFDTHNSPLNVRNNQDRRYSYGTLPLFLTRITAEWLDRACGESPDSLSAAGAALLVGLPDSSSDTFCSPGTFTGGRSKQVGRALSALADLGTLVVVYLIGRRLYGETVGLLAAGLGALTAFSIQQAHFFTVDSMACFFTMLFLGTRKSVGELDQLCAGGTGDRAGRRLQSQRGTGCSPRRYRCYLVPNFSRLAF